MTIERATFAAGCFWGVEAAFWQIAGVTSTEVGYTGGDRPNPSYEGVCTGATGHAEAVRIEFDPERVSYDQLLEHFWQLHDPTQVDRQGPDRGSQYRSAIFFNTPEQQTAAKASKEQTQQLLHKPIATEITPASEFYRAEEYHQRYFEKTGRTSCPL